MSLLPPEPDPDRATRPWFERLLAAAILGLGCWIAIQLLLAWAPALYGYSAHPEQGPSEVEGRSRRT